MHCFRRGISSFSLPVFVLTASLYAQNVAQPPAVTAPKTVAGQPVGQSSSSSQGGTILQKKNWVRLISVGASLSVLGQQPLINGAAFNTATNFEQTAETQAGGARLGWGGVVQVRLPKRFAFAGTFVINRSSHKRALNSFSGLDNPNTPLDDRIRTEVSEETNVRYWNYGALLRWYTRPHTEAGTRFFFEGGPTFRKAHKVATNRTTIVGATETKDTTPIRPDRSVATGLTGGIGAQFVDDFGVRFVPEFRFTRWNNLNFDSNSTSMRKNQFEAIVSITF